MNKKKKIIIIILILIAVSVFVGLGITGFKIGWGPFAKLRYYNNVTYNISDNNYKYTCEKKTIEGDNGSIVGHLYLSDNGSDKQELIILSHGYATEQWHNLSAAQSLAKAGISVFTFDYCGGSIHSESDGVTTDMSILTEKEDLNAVIDEVKSWPEIDSEKICIMGYSQGGLVAAITAAERNDIYKLGLVYPAFTMFDEIRGTYNETNKPKKISDRLGMKVGKIYFEDILSSDIENIYSYAAKYEGPVYLIHGTADQAVPYESSVMADQYYENSELYLIENAGHGFKGKDDVTFVKKVYGFFK